MRKEDMYIEEQKFNQKWIYILLITILILFITGLIYQKITGHLIGNQPMSNNQYLFCIIFFIFLIIAIKKLKIKLTIDKSGIIISLFSLKFIKYKWDNIEKVFIRNYDTIGEFGGWGVRYSFSNGLAFIISGNKGLQIVLKTNKKVLISTQLPEKLQSFLDTLQINTE
ncbi:MAG: hypothetical protein KKE39_01925 [Bacteroidetes bacterium]|nr:hypothetical protein [Bacteroidota bacterium]MBU1373948.1 hypothetical protein [Bacteroidota bacterium]MBU1485324.1 hypothetical protein [Bacteroidota bacterium]MBU2268871.1 hypothetical protein [Bacteroidota bacterium]MBU2377312.1 hypothetical protein [Bacteroidota bacterium]